LSEIDLEATIFKYLSSATGVVTPEGVPFNAFYATEGPAQQACGPHTLRITSSAGDSPEGLNTSPKHYGDVGEKRRRN